jgi:Pvc16 N-terminal domain
MSNFLAIATVTAALRQVISDAVTVDVPGADVQVSHVRPAGQPLPTPKTGVNVFLYAVTPNAAQRNGDLPTRRGEGQLVQRPQAALDLHYLLTFYGDDGVLETHRLLGSVARTLHSAPTIPRAKLQEVVAHNAFLTRSDMADAVQAVRFTPITLSLEELSKLWSVLFQTPYALSAAYQGSVVFIEGTDAPQPSLPVKARNVYAVPFAQPVLEAVENAAGPFEPIVSTSTLLLRGERLRGDVIRVRLGLGGEEVEPAEVRSKLVTLPLASVPAATLRAGVQGVQVVQKRLLGTPLRPHRGAESNVVPFVLRPTLVDAPTFTAGAAGPPSTPPKITVKVTPEVGKTQRAVLLLNELGAAPPNALSFVSPRRAAVGQEIDFEVPGVTAGTYLVRVQVDGAESLLVSDATGAYVSPQVVVP